MSKRQKIAIFGAGGHAKVIVDIVERQGQYEIAFLVEQGKVPEGKTLFGYPVITHDDSVRKLAGMSSYALIAIGDNAARRRLASVLEAEGWEFATAIHPAAVIGKHVTIGAGTVVMAGCVVNPDARIGRHVIINTGASVDHDCEVGDGVHVAPGCRLCGGVHVGRGSFLGAGTIVIPGIRIGSDVQTGAGTTVIRDVADGAKLAGVPAKSLD